ncbi:MAG: hypothetical protein KKB37_04665 [Alphaproteobacteria bacterium]|nr:hypothetical protein [Alphaproteobacteria bacterium]
MFEHGRQTSLQVIAALIAVSALAASAIAVLFPAIYLPFVPNDQLVFNFGQDLLSLVAAILLLATVGRTGVKTDVARIGVVGYLFYAFAPYVMAAIYNDLYFLYLAVFGLSIFYFIIAFTSIEYDKITFRMPESLRVALALYCAAVAVFFAPQWVVALLHDIQTVTWPGNTGFDIIYYVYMLDLCFVLPVFGLASVLLLKKMPLGYVLGGALSIKGFTLMLSVAAGFVFQPIFGGELDIVSVFEFLALSFVFMVLAVAYFLVTKAER